MNDSKLTAMPRNEKGVNSQIKPGNIPTIKRLKTIQNLINFQISSGNFIGIIKI